MDAAATGRDGGDIELDHGAPRIQLCILCALALASACASPNSGRNLQPDLQEIPLLRDEWVMVANSELAARLAGVPQEQ